MVVTGRRAASAPTTCQSRGRALRGRAGAGVQLPRCAARGLRGLCREPEVGGLGASPRSLRRRWSLRRHARPPCPAACHCRHRGWPRRHRGRLQDRSAFAIAGRLRQAP
jgi:hypothetical protein